MYSPIDEESIFWSDDKLTVQGMVGESSIKMSRKQFEEFKVALSNFAQSKTTIGQSSSDEDFNPLNFQISLNKDWGVVEAVFESSSSSLSLVFPFEEVQMFLDEVEGK